MADSTGRPFKGAVSLSAAIGALRDELWSACWDGQNNRLKFKPAPVELTLQVALTVDVKANAGVKWWLIEAGGELSRESVATQTVRLTLEPVMFDQQGIPLPEIFIDADDADVGRERSDELPLDAEE